MSEYTLNPAQILGEALASAGLFPSPTNYRTALNRIEEQGSLAVDDLSILFESETWYLANNSLPKAYISGDLKRIFGFGKCTTDFLVAYTCLNSSEEGHWRVRTAGGLANFIVAVYDQFMENGNGDDILPDCTLYRLRSFSANKTLAIEKNIDARRRVIEYLVQKYFETLSPLVNEKNQRLFVLLNRCINRMQDAERRTLNAEVCLNRRTWLRKSGLPFVTMGFPVWFEANNMEGSTVRGHIHWMYRIGRLLGFVDDFVDYSSDLLNNKNNSLVGLTPGAIVSLANDIAREGTKLQAIWRTRVDSTAFASCGSVFGALLASWVGM